MARECIVCTLDRWVSKWNRHTYRIQRPGRSVLQRHNHSVFWYLHAIRCMVFVLDIRQKKETITKQFIDCIFISNLKRRPYGLWFGEWRVCMGLSSLFIKIFVVLPSSSVQTVWFDFSFLPWARHVSSLTQFKKQMASLTCFRRYHLRAQSAKIIVNAFGMWVYEKTGLVFSFGVETYRQLRILCFLMG